MNNKQRGFTLIELLAIIVILAIIAVITVPIILNVIDNAKQGTAKDSAYGYKDAISKYYVSSMLEENSIQLNGTYNIVDGKLGEYDIPFSGTKPTSGYLTYKNNILTNGCLTIDEYKIEFKNGEVVKTDKGTCESEPTKTTYKCKRATNLHTEECTQTSGYCYAAGYHSEGSKQTNIVTYGNLKTDNILKSGDAFDCDVNGNGEYEDTERFYYVSDLYNTTTKQFDSSYAVMIYYSNTYNGQANNTTTSIIAYNSDNINYSGPITGIVNLPKIQDWKNITLSKTTRTIVNQNGEATSGNGTNALPNYNYDNYASRLLTTQEVESACNISIGSITAGELYGCDFLLENTKYTKSDQRVFGYWLETPRENNSTNIWYIYSGNASVNNFSAHSNETYGGVRPVIEVLKTDIEI